MKVIPIFLVIAPLAMEGSSPPSPLSAPPGALRAQAWNIQYSPGMPAHPIAMDDGWYFDFPAPTCGEADVCSVHYVSTPVKMSATTRGQVNAVFQVTTTGKAVFNYQLNPNNTCDYP